jgi:hypothetical protein
MLTIQYISDIHLEFLHIEEIKSKARKIIPICPILILAGDIGNPFQKGYKLFIEEMNNKFEKVFIISGNHEYYGGKSMEETEIQIKDIIKDYKNVSYLQNSYEDYNGIRYIGTTLWSNITDPNYKINDVYSIKEMDIDLYNNLHKQSVEFLTKTLSQSKEYNCILITHHLPSYKLIDKIFMDQKVSMYNQWFASCLDDIMIQYSSNIKGWFYGHTHLPNITNLYGVDTYCNPVGYKGENSKPDYNKIVVTKL